MFGFRAHLAQQSVASRAFYRTVLMKGFHWYVQLFVTRSVQDTQCGFKLFTRSTAEVLFSNLHLYRWAFDTEIIYLAEKLHIPIVEVFDWLIYSRYCASFSLLFK
jgi:dolichyl-phosphate beta-glucosyltransferase